jgi:hypothetical protein
MIKGYHFHQKCLAGYQKRYITTLNMVSKPQVAKQLVIVLILSKKLYISFPQLVFRDFISEIMGIYKSHR